MSYFNSPSQFTQIDCQNFLDPKIHLVGFKHGHEKKSVINDFYNQNYWVNDFDGPEATEAKGRPGTYIDRSRSLKKGDVLVLQTRSSPNTAKIVGIGIVVGEAIQFLGDEAEDARKVQVMSWTLKDLNFELPFRGPFEKGVTISNGYKLSELIKEVEGLDEIKESYLKLLTEISKARSKFLRLHFHISPTIDD